MHILYKTIFNRCFVYYYKINFTFRVSAIDLKGLRIGKGMDRFPICRIIFLFFNFALEARLETTVKSLEMKIFEWVPVRL